MGTLYRESPPLLHDLKVTIQDSTLIFSPQQSERRSMFLSNIDQVLNFDVQTIHFFAENPEFPPETLLEKLQNALQKLLLTYDYLAGRIKPNPETGRLEIDCKNAGIGFVIASSEYTLDELGDLVYPNPAFEQLVTKKMNDALQVDDHPLCIVQATTFKCGGFAIGVQTNHVTFDGIGANYFLQNLAAVAGDKPLAVVPCNDRELLAARSPPRVTFTHPELLKFEDIPIGNQNGDNDPSEENVPNVFDNKTPPRDLDFKIFSLSSEDISNLKAMAKKGPSNGKGKITSFNVVSAHVWRCRALSSEEGNNSERLSTILYAVDIRARLNPPLPTSYAGNAVLTSYATAKCKELEEGSIGKLVDLMSEGVVRMTDEYARSVIDWGELHKGYPHGELLLSSWWRLGFNKVEFPWGKPKYSCPLVDHRKDIILLFPDIDEANGGVNVLVALPHKGMEKFQALFHKYLNH